MVLLVKAIIKKIAEKKREKKTRVKAITPKNVIDETGRNMNSFKAVSQVDVSSIVSLTYIDFEIN